VVEVLANRAHEGAEPGAAGGEAADEAIGVAGREDDGLVIADLGDPRGRKLVHRPRKAAGPSEDSPALGRNPLEPEAAGSAEAVDRQVGVPHERIFEPGVKFFPTVRGERCSEG